VLQIFWDEPYDLRSVRGMGRVHSMQPAQKECPAANPSGVAQSPKKPNSEATLTVARWRRRARVKKEGARGRGREPSAFTPAGQDPGDCRMMMMFTIGRRHVWTSTKKPLCQYRSRVPASSALPARSRRSPGCGSITLICSSVPCRGTQRPGQAHVGQGSRQVVLVDQLRQAADRVDAL
jgi:hypothetical protein